jgi:hypothetical protein
MIDRRQFVTGLVAVAVAGVPLVLPIRAAQFTPRMFALNGYWHFDMWPDGGVEIRDDDSTFGFYNPPRPDGTPVFDCIAPGDPPHLAGIFRAFARAATFVAKHASRIRSARDGDHPCSIRLCYSQRDPRRPFDDVIIEDSEGVEGLGGYFAFDEDFLQVYTGQMELNRGRRLSVEGAT